MRCLDLIRDEGGVLWTPNLGLTLVVQFGWSRWVRHYLQEGAKQFDPTGLGEDVAELESRVEYGVVKNADWIQEERPSIVVSFVGVSTLNRTLERTRRGDSNEQGQHCQAWWDVENQVNAEVS